MDEELWGWETRAPERRATRTRRILEPAIGYAALVGGVALAALPLVTVADPGNRPIILRLAAAVVLAVALAHVRSAFRRSVGAEPAPASRTVATAERDEPIIARHFQEVADDLRFGRSSGSFWSRVLRPRLAALSGRLPGPAISLDVPVPRWRRMLGLGPSAAALRDLVAQLEAQERP